MLVMKYNMKKKIAHRVRCRYSSDRRSRGVGEAAEASSRGVDRHGNHAWRAAAKDIINRGFFDRVE